MLPPQDNYLTVYTPPGTILSPLITSAGKVLLSRFDDNSIDRLYDLHFSNEIKGRVAPKDEFIKSVRFIRRHGYCFDEREYGEHVYGIANPLRNESGKLIAAINMSIPKNRLTPELKDKYIQTTLKIASEFSIRF